MKMQSIWVVLCGALLTASVHAAATDEEERSMLNFQIEQGKKAIKAQDWKGALNQFHRAEQRDPANADIQNYLGYSYRKNGQLEPAFKHYRQALKLKPDHIGAHEYIGEAYLMANQPEKAEEHLTALQKYCKPGCEEYAELKEKIAAYRTKKP